MSRIALCGLTGSAFLLLASLGSAATFQVASSADAPDSGIDGDCGALVFTGVGFVETCTLRAAVDEANATSERDTIELPAGTYSLTLDSGASDGDDDANAGDDLDITEDVLIQAQTIADPSATVILNPEAEDLPQAIEVLGSNTGLTLQGVTVTGAGVGIRNEGSLDLLDCRVSGNASTGVANSGGTATIERCEIVENGSGAAFSSGGVGNTAGGVTLRESTVAENVGNTAGGIGTGSTSEGDAVLIAINSTIADNEAVGDTFFTTPIPSGGGGIAQTEGGGSTSTAIFRNVTITGNFSEDGGGGVNVAAGSFSLANSVIDGNSTLGSGPDCLGSIASDGYVVLGSASGCTFASGSTDRVGGPDNQLGMLADNGGPTRTAAPAAASPLVDAGDPDGCKGIGFFAPAPELDEDQRGFPRPESPDGRCDIGAVELVPEPGGLALGAAALGVLAVLRSSGARRESPPTRSSSRRCGSGAGKPVEPG